MPTLLHESLVHMFRMSPAFAADVLATALGVAVPAYDRAAVTSADLTALLSVEFRADVVVELWARDADGKERRVLAIVTESQLAVDDDKTFTWPAYATQARARLRCPAYVLVVAVDPAVAAWAAQPIEVSPGLGTWRPLVFGPRAIPRVTDPTFAHTHPELTVLSALAHAAGEGDEGEAIVRAVPAAMAALDAESGRAYLLLLRSALRSTLRRLLEALMIEKTPFGEFEVPEWLLKAENAAKKKGLAEGLAEGRVAGRTEGLAVGQAEALLTVLAVRGIALDAEREAAVRACKDAATLTRWLRAAATATTAAAVFDAPTRVPVKRKPSKRQ